PLTGEDFSQSENCLTWFRHSHTGLSRIPPSSNQAQIRKRGFIWEALMSGLRFAPRRFAGALYALALTLSLTISISLHAQVAGTGTIQGIVTDPTGAFLPGATVTLTEESTHVVRTAKTDSAGAYVFPNIVVGSYTLTVADAGFQTYSKIHNVLEVGSSIGIDAHLALGKEEQTVTVEAEGLALQTEDAKFK